MNLIDRERERDSSHLRPFCSTRIFRSNQIEKQSQQLVNTRTIIMSDNVFALVFISSFFYYYENATFRLDSIMSSDDSFLILNLLSSIWMRCDAMRCDLINMCWLYQFSTSVYDCDKRNVWYTCRRAPKICSSEFQERKTRWRFTKIKQRFGYLARLPVARSSLWSMFEMCVHVAFIIGHE